MNMFVLLEDTFWPVPSREYRLKFFHLIKHQNNVFDHSCVDNLSVIPTMNYYPRAFKYHFPTIIFTHNQIKLLINNLEQLFIRTIHRWPIHLDKNNERNETNELTSARSALFSSSRWRIFCWYCCASIVLKVEIEKENDRNFIFVHWKMNSFSSSSISTRTFLFREFLLVVRVHCKIEWFFL